MRRAPTEAEHRLWQILRAKRLDGYKFKRQVPIDHYIADFVCLGRRLIVEADGGQHDPQLMRTGTPIFRHRGFASSGSGIPISSTTTRAS